MMNRRIVRQWAGSTAVLIVLLFMAGALQGQTENVPPKPDRYITDEAGVLDGATLAEVNAELEQFEKDTSNQIVVAIYPSLPPEAEIAQYATDTYHAWGIGQRGKDNGALLMVFVQDHKMFISTGRGLEGALPDAICKNIVTQVIGPAFKRGDYGGGIRGGVSAMISATKGEYQGNGTTDAERNGAGQGIPWAVIIIFIVIFLLSRYGSAYGGWGGPFIFTGGGFGGGYGGGGGGGFGGGGGGGGGFSGGGGDSAGGGAGGSW